MKYMLLMYSNQSEAPQTTPEEHQSAVQATRAFVQASRAFVEEAKAAGVWLANSGLSSVEDTTTVRVRDGKALITDGPFAETHEQLAGYFLFECKDLDEAIAWAMKIPMATVGSIEVRPLWPQT